MSREKPKTKYKVKIKNFGNGAKIKAYKSQIGKEALIMVIDKYYCGSCVKAYLTEQQAKLCCKTKKSKNKRIKKVIYGTEQLKELTELKENFEKGW